jgi:hypothetical protein
VKNILATSAPSSRFAGLGWPAIFLALALLGAALWGIWATGRLLALEKREVVTVQLSGIMGEFVEAEARSGRSPEEMQAHVQAYLQAVEASVEHLGREGRTVLIAEAVVAGSAKDLTEAVRADVARRMGAAPDGKR